MGHTICEKRECTGCSVCVSSCPKKAIKIDLDECGFYRPKIEDNLCVNCNVCNRVCPVNNPPEVYGPTKAFAFQNTEEVRFNSTSGGFFHAIACRIIDDGGVVCGAAFEDDMVLRHIIVAKKEELAPLQRSKYVESSLDGIYTRIRDYLRNGRKVLFAGVGCQAAALRNYIGEDKNLIIIDLVCYGVPSSGLFRDWITYIEKKYAKVVDVRFRDKSYGYYTPNIKVLFENGKYIENCRDSNIYAKLFFRNLSVRESCFSCHFKTVDRSSDITLGDLWQTDGLETIKDDDKGTTCLFSHTEKGKELCQELGAVEIDKEMLLAKDAQKMVSCISTAAGTGKFWELYKERGFEVIINTYEKDNFLRKVKYLIKSLLNRTGLSRWMYRKLKMKKIRDNR
ncbi:MAG: Coenzyme F420 hydrogenase/dehydrogenase, beta subunit C-terminal domain [Clostridiales bacterium]|nr:Coenzyme F420 hydrogenase/dehydrogenase, beta subunit C-terminal domain [Clostridiales bacterium]